MTNHPRIGVPGMWSGSVHGLRFHGLAVATAVLESIVRAGGEPIPMFPRTVLDDDERYGSLDGIVLPGGADIDPARYGAEPDELTALTDHPGQDEADAAVVRNCIERRIPALLICRGMQLLNVECGGTLSQHAATDPIDHVGSIHAVTAAHGSLLAQAWGATERTVSSYHHQTVAEIGAGLRVTATAPDGVVEALEAEGLPILAVQWHPEDRSATEQADAALFEWLVARTREEVRVG
jgi:putative glutamine amidotransferase